MIFKDIARYSKLLLLLVVAFIIVQIYYNLRFAVLANIVDKKQPLTHPIAFEAFPFVVYNMYSGHIEDWKQYSCLEIEADGQLVPLTDMAVIKEDYLLNPTAKFVDLLPGQFNDPNLYAYLQYSLDSSAIATSIYERVSNHSLNARKDDWGRWMQRYLTAILKRDVHTIKILKNIYQYNTLGAGQKKLKKLFFTNINDSSQSYPRPEKNGPMVLWVRAFVFMLSHI